MTTEQIERIVPVIKTFRRVANRLLGATPTKGEGRHLNDVCDEMERLLTAPEYQWIETSGERPTYASDRTFAIPLSFRSVLRLESGERDEFEPGDYRVTSDSYPFSCFIHKAEFEKHYRLVAIEDIKEM